MKKKEEANNKQTSILTNREQKPTREGTSDNVGIYWTRVGSMV